MTPREEAGEEDPPPCGPLHRRLDPLLKDALHKELHSLLGVGKDVRHPLHLVLQPQREKNEEGGPGQNEESRDDQFMQKLLIEHVAQIMTLFTGSC